MVSSVQADTSEGSGGIMQVWGRGQPACTEAATSPGTSQGVKAAAVERQRHLGEVSVARLLLALC